MILIHLLLKARESTGGPKEQIVDTRVDGRKSNGNNHEISLALAFTFNANLEPGSCEDEGEGFVRDTVRLNEMWGNESVGIAVSIVEAHVVTSPRFLRSDFTATTGTRSGGFIEALQAHVTKYQLEPSIREVFLDYLWMPDSWAVTKYGKNEYGLLSNILELGMRISPSVHIKEGGVVILPIPWQFYHGIVTSEHWEQLNRLYFVDYIAYNDAQSSALVSSDMKIKELILLLGKDVEKGLKKLTEKGERCDTLQTSALPYWRGKDDIFMKLTRRTHGI
jgi:hypothetical protein